jgi:acylphosphatase
MTEAVSACRWLLSGRVQGVGFRWFTVRRATEHGVVGWVRNLPDGRVEVQAKGPVISITLFEADLARGPSMARVENVDKADVPLEVIDDKSFVLR